MATIVEIEETELEHLSDCIEKMLRIGGKAMSYIEKLKSLEEEEEEEELPKKSKRRKSMKDQDDEYLRYY